MVTAGQSPKGTTPNSNDLTPAQWVACLLFSIPLVFCSMEMVPGWGAFNLGWPPSVFFAIMAACGAVAGFLGPPGHRVPGLVGGLVAGVGSLAGTWLLLAHTTITLSFLIACATAFVTGALAMAIAVFKVGTRRTIFSFYLFIMLYLAIPLALEKMGYFQYQWNFDSAGKPLTHISYFAGFHPFLALRVIFGETAYRPPEAGMVQGYSWPWNWYLSSPHTFYITFITKL